MAGRVTNFTATAENKQSKIKMNRATSHDTSEVQERPDSWAPMRRDQSLRDRRLEESELMARVMGYTAPELSDRCEAFGLPVIGLTPDDLRSQLLLYYRRRY